MRCRIYYDFITFFYDETRMYIIILKEECIMKNKVISLVVIGCLSLSLVACGSTKENTDNKNTTTSETVDNQETTNENVDTQNAINYLALVNKLNPLPDGWEDALEISTTTNSIGDEVEVEKNAYDSYLKLKADLEKEDIFVDLDSARRSVAEQQRIMDDFTEKYGADYAKKTVATPGFSEHHTGLALDLYLIIDGKDVIENEDMIQYTDIWAKIHEKLADYGFILRYLQGKEHITGYGYEPWHIRYVDDAKVANEIMASGSTLEEYLGAVDKSDVTIDYGNSEKYSKEELDDAIIQIKCDFASWEGCTLKSLRYAGDECTSEENLKKINELSDGNTYTKVVEFLGDFHSPKEGGADWEGGGAWEADKDYKDYQWWLGLTEEDGWEIVNTGY